MARFSLSSREPTVSMSDSWSLGCPWLWLEYHQENWICCGCFREFRQVFFITLRAYLKVRRTRLLIGMFPRIYPPRVLKLQCFLISGCKGIWRYAYLRSILKNEKLPVLFLLSEMYLATESMRLSMDCIWHLFFSMASFKSLESNASLMDWSYFTAMTTWLMKTLSEHFSSLIICFASNKCRISLYTLSVRCNGTLR